MAGILHTFYCLPCVWTLISLGGTYFVINYIRNIWVPFRGPTPSDGPVHGFPSKAAEIDFYDTNPLRIRTTWKWGMICAVIWAGGALLTYIGLNLWKG